MKKSALMRSAREKIEKSIEALRLLDLPLFCNARSTKELAEQLEKLLPTLEVLEKYYKTVECVRENLERGLSIPAIAERCNADENMIKAILTLEGEE